MRQRYHLFAGANYYPNGGMYDYVGTFDTLEAAKEAAESGEYTDWANIAQIRDGDLVWLLQFHGTWEEVPACDRCGHRSLRLLYDEDGLICEECDDRE